MPVCAQIGSKLSNQIPCIVTCNGTLVPTKAVLKIASVISLLTQFALAVKRCTAETYCMQAGTEFTLYSLLVLRQIILNIFMLHADEEKNKNVQWNLLNLFNWTCWWPSDHAN